jgi:ankyrin repeat protein
VFAEFDGKDFVHPEVYESLLPTGFDAFNEQEQTAARVAAREAVFRANREPYKQRATYHIADVPLPPSAVVDSGGGYHCYWLLAEPYALDNTTRELARKVLQAWVALVGGDTSAADITRVLRAVGTKNHKYEDKPRIEIVLATGEVYVWSQFEDATGVDAVLLSAQAADECRRREAKGKPVDDVIAEFNRTHTLVDLLTAHGYQEGRRSQTAVRLARPGRDRQQTSVVVFTDGEKQRSYHHSSNDGLHVNGHTHDAFDVWTVLEHGGNASAAYEAAKRAQGKWEPVAAARNNAAAIKALVQSGADLKVRTNNPAGGGGRGNSVFNSPAPTGFSALLFAVRSGSVDAVRALLDAGADVNETLSDGESALVVAAANAHWEVSSLLIDRGADPNAAAAGWNALHQTVHSRRPNLGYTPGPVPTGNTDSIEVVKKLIAKGIDIDARMTKNGMKDGQRNRHNRLGATASLLAAKRVDVEVMKVLAAAGANAKIPAADGNTPLMVAAGTAMWYVGEDGGSMAGHEHEAVEAVKICVELGNDVNARNDVGETPLHGAAFRGVNEIVEYLVAKGATLDVRDSRGWTAFTIANGISYGDVYKLQPQTAKLLEQLMTARGLSTDGQSADGTECLDCVQTHQDQARASLERDRRMEAEFAKAEAERLELRRQ